MNLICIYGPPAVGKLTVAKELTKLTGYKLFHNQLTVDLLLSLFEFNSPEFKKLNTEIRLQLINHAAKAGISGIILTFCYAKGSDDEVIKRLIEKVENDGGEVNFVRLICEKKELQKRVKQDSRKKHYKIQTVGLLNKVLNESNLFSQVPFKKSLTIDNTKISAKETAQKIATHLGLTKQE